MSLCVVGTCSICGGRVTVPLVFWSVVPPVPTCESCGAVEASHGPVIPMQPARQQPLTGTGTGQTIADWLRTRTTST